jgi:hypothetical protein
MKKGDPLVGGTRQRGFDGTSLKPGVLPEKAVTPTSLSLGALLRVGCTLCQAAI